MIKPQGLADVTKIPTNDDFHYQELLRKKQLKVTEASDFVKKELLENKLR